MAQVIKIINKIENFINYFYLISLVFTVAILAQVIKMNFRVLLLSGLQHEINNFDENDIPNFYKIIFKLFALKKYNKFSIAYEDMSYSKMTLDLYNKLLINDKKELTVIIQIDYIKLLKMYGENQLCDWMLLNVKLKEDDYDSITVQEFQNIDELEDEFGHFCYLQIDSEKINLDNTFYNFQIIIKYYYDDEIDKINIVDCKGNKCRKYLDKCKERYCESCHGELNDLYISQLLELCFSEVEYNNEDILSKNYRYHDDCDSDDDVDERYIKLLFDPEYECYLSSLCLTDRNVIKINYFTEIS